MSAHISHHDRLSWNNGFHSGANISTSCWRWRVGHPPPNVPCAGNMEGSSVRTALEDHFFAKTAVWSFTGILHSIGHFNGLQLTTLQSVCNHSDLCYSLGTMVHHAHKQLRYAHIQAFKMCLAYIHLGNQSCRGIPCPPEGLHWTFTNPPSFTTICGRGV